MTSEPPAQLNIADFFLDARVREGRGDRTALITDAGRWSYREVQALANRYANLLRSAGVAPEQRVIIALPDGPDYVAALFGTLKIGAVVVMVNPELKPETIEYFFGYSRASVALVAAEAADAFRAAASRSAHPPTLLIVGGSEWEARVAAAPDSWRNFPTHPDDAAIWLFSGGTTGRPKAAVQPHRSFVNTAQCYAHHVLSYTEDDITISVPKLYFGYATGSNLLFPFAAGAAAVLFGERCTAEVLFAQIRTHRPTVLVTVPTMINQMVSHPAAGGQDFSSLRLATSAGEGLPEELHVRWDEGFGVPLLDGLGTAEMWHIFISNRAGRIRRGTLGEVVPGFEVKVADDEGRALADGETGQLWVRGGSRALGYWQQLEKSQTAFRGEWVVSGDLIRRDADGYYTYGGRADELLKVGGKWLSATEVEGCLLLHPAVSEVAVVGVADANGLVKPHAYVIARERRDDLAEELKAFVRERLEPYKHPREVIFVDALPTTHLGKVDRGKLRAERRSGD
ncbi:MAG: benzoate-CoA ligase family protein [Gemmatimonadota bacterium]|nr:benzoate-CoA ligase family protein [Gemmatimonadota bacterium]MDZ4864238.1 benzoate-CoA ligase family protein [Gemmatimonadota bacterium]